MMGSKSDQFVHDLVQFYRNRGSHNTHSQQFVARLNGKVVNLLELYSYVLELGGSFKVNQTNQWDDIYCKLFKTSTTGANISVALRQIYSRFLLPYEKAFSSNFGNDLLDDEEDESNLFFASHSSNLCLPPHPYQPLISPNGVLDSAHPFNKLFCSILSRLPNELDFALKVATILTNSNRLDWSTDFRFIDLLLESSLYYCCVCQEENNLTFESESNEKLQCNEEHNEQNHPNCECYQRFWHQCCSNEQALELVFGARHTKLDEFSSQLFALIKQRIRLIADLIRNLSFTADTQSHDNVSSNLFIAFSVGTTNMFKFLLLMMMCDEPNYNKIAFDILSNIASITTIVNDNAVEFSHLQQYIYRYCVSIAMTSDNIYFTSRSLEIISRLLSTCNEELNCLLESYFSEYEIFTRITQLLTCHYDITLLLAILDFCLAISEQKPQLLIKESNKYLIKILLSLLNCETSNHFTESALKRIKVIDDRPRTQVNSTNDTNSSQTNHSTVQLNSLSSTSQSNIVDNETFALNWLKTTYEPTTNCIKSLKVSELYAEYVKYCCRSSRRNVIAAQSFSQLIKRCFPSCSITSNHTLIEGIVAKCNTLSQTKSNQNPSSQLASPILKAHLSAPPKNSNNSSTNVNIINNKSCSDGNTNCNIGTNSIVSNENSSSNNNVKSNVTANCNSVLSTPTTNTSTLIKSLLANKLRSNATICTTASTSTKSTSCATIPTFMNDSLSVLMTQTSASNFTSIVTSSPTTNTSITSLPATTPSLVTNESNNESSVIVAQQQPSTTLTLTPSITIATPNSIISTTNSPLSSLSTQSVQQPPQQFLLVRTIIASTGQQQSGCSGLTTTGTPVRLILPASMLTQQRLTNPSVNGISASQTPLNNVTISTSNSITTTISNISTNSSSTDLFLKTVLSGSNTSNSVPVNPLRSNVKSSPLLNVLLDKGKLPDFTSASNMMNNQASPLTNAANVMQPQAPKMYILTTKSPLAIKSLPTLQTQAAVQSAQQTIQSLTQQQQLTPISNVIQQNSIQTSHASALITNASVSSFPQSLVTTASMNHTKLSPPKICIPTAINGELSNTNSPVNTISPIKTNSLNTLSVNDLSSIKDIKKTVDDATKLIAKRRNEEESITANKKVKLNSVMSNALTPCSLSTIPQITVNHDPSSHQVLTKASSISTSLSPITSIPTTTIVTTTPSVNSINISSNNGVSGEYECLWHECKKSFLRAAEVFLHVHNHHVMPSTFPNSMTCLWGGTEGTGPGCLSKRPKLSLLTHLLDFHCNTNVLQQELVRKKQLASKGSTSIVLQQPPAHPGYANNAALLAIRRHATNYVEMPVVPPVTQLTPLTVSIRLTAALILRNLAQHSSYVKRSLESFEPYLCELSMSDGRDESRTIAQCLAVISEKNVN